MMKDIVFLSDRYTDGSSRNLIKIDLNRTCHALVVGGSGSGKTSLAALMSAKVGLANPSSKLWLLSFKNEDALSPIRQTNGARYYQYADCMRGLEDFNAVFQSRLAGAPDRSFHLLWIDELAAFILSLKKSEAEAAKSTIASILMMGRSMGCQILTSVQRASADLFTLGARDNYGLILGMGNLSKEAISMMGFDKDFLIPATRPGEGNLLINSTEQCAIRASADLGDNRIMAQVMETVKRMAVR